MYFNYKYLYEATGQRAGIGTLTELIDDPANAGRISKAIDAEFENSDVQTKTETEQAFRASFIAMAGNLALLLNGIGLAVAFTILLVTANTMSIAVRERQQEIGVLKTLGFPSGLVMALILIEALLLGVMGGALGLLFAGWRDPCAAEHSVWRRRRGASIPGIGVVAQNCFLRTGRRLAARATGWAGPCVASVSCSDH